MSIEEVKARVQSQLEATDEVQGMLQAAYDRTHEIQANVGQELSGTANSGADELLGVLGQAMEQVQSAQSAVAAARSTGENVVATL